MTFDEFQESKLRKERELDLISQAFNNLGQKRIRVINAHEANVKATFSPGSRWSCDGRVVECLVSEDNMPFVRFLDDGAMMHVSTGSLTPLPVAASDSGERDGQDKVGEFSSRLLYHDAKTGETLEILGVGRYDHPFCEQENECVVLRRPDGKVFVVKRSNFLAELGKMFGDWAGK